MYYTVVKRSETRFTICIERVAKEHKLVCFGRYNTANEAQRAATALNIEEATKQHEILDAVR